MSNGKTTSAVATVGDYALMKMDPAELREVMEANVGDGGIGEFDLDRIRVPAGGGLTWEVPTLAGTEETKELEGVIVAWRDVRAYWRESFDASGGGSPPDCRSIDGKHGDGDPGGDCTRCPLAKFGTSEKGRGQACRMMRLLFFIRRDQILPAVVVAPPTSLKPVRSYFLRLASGQVPYYGVVTRLSLAKDKSGDGITYSKILPELGGRLTDDEQRRMLQMHETLMPTLDAQVRQVVDDEGAADAA